MKKIYLFIILFFYNHQLFIINNKFLAKENEHYEQIMDYDYKEKDHEQFQELEDNNENYSTSKLIFLIIMGIVGCGILIYLVPLLINFMKKNNNSSSLQNSSTHLLNPDSNGQQPIIIDNNSEDPSSIQNSLEYMEQFFYVDIPKNILENETFKNDLECLKIIKNINIKLKELSIKPLNLKDLQIILKNKNKDENIADFIQKEAFLYKINLYLWKSKKIDRLFDDIFFESMTKLFFDPLYSQSLINCFKRYVKQEGTNSYSYKTYEDLLTDKIKLDQNFFFYIREFKSSFSNFTYKLLKNMCIDMKSITKEDIEKFKHNIKMFFLAVNSFILQGKKSIKNIAITKDSYSKYNIDNLYDEFLNEKFHLLIDYFKFKNIDKNNDLFKKTKNFYTFFQINSYFIKQLEPYLI